MNDRMGEREWKRQGLEKVGGWWCGVGGEGSLKQVWIEQTERQVLGPQEYSSLEGRRGAGIEKSGGGHQHIWGGRELKPLLWLQRGHVGSLGRESLGNLSTHGVGRNVIKRAGAVKSEWLQQKEEESC